MRHKTVIAILRTNHILVQAMGEAVVSARDRLRTAPAIDHASKTEC